MRDNRRAALAGALALALLASAARAATYYVATNGSNSNPGSSAAPFATVQAGVNAAHAGDTIIVDDSTYGCPGGQDSMAITINSAGTSSAWITLRAANSGKAVLDGQLVCHSVIAVGGSAAYWIIKGFDIRNGRWGGIWSNSGGGHNMLIQGNVIHNIGNRYETASTGIVGIYADTGASNFKVDGNTFHDVGRTGVLTGTHDHSIYTHAGGMIITNNLFFNILNGWHIQTAAGFQGTIANNTFYGPDPWPGSVGQVMLWDVNSNVIIRNNIFYNANGYGITTYQSSISGTCSIDHNIFYKAGGSIGTVSPLPSGCSESNEKVNVDPKLSNASNDNFFLTAGSPAIDAGVTIPGVTNDFMGTSRPQGAAFDIGALEYVGGGSTGGGSSSGQSSGSGSAPALSGVGAANVTSSAATIVWTTGSAADSSVDYGRTASYGATVTSAAKVTSHSITLSGLAGGSLYHFRVRSTYTGGNSSSSGDATFTTSGRVTIVPAPAPITVIPSPSGVQTAGTGGVASTPAAGGGACVSAAAAWQNIALPARTGTFTVEFDAKASAAKMDGVMGLSNGPAGSYAAQAAAVRFNNAGRLDARNGGAYAAATAIPYSPNIAYHFRLVVNLAAKTYSAYVRTGAATEQTLGLNYAFRTEQKGAAALNDLGAYASTGGVTVCNATAQ